MNSIYEYGGLCDVIVRCNSERTIGGKTYKANEPYTILKDVVVNLSYRTTTHEGTSRNNVMAAREGLPDYVSISNIEFTDKVACLIADKQEQKFLSNFCECEAWNGEIYFPAATEVGNVWLYNANNELITDYTIETDKLVGNFEEGQKYLAFYNYLSAHKCFSFETPHYGYFTLEVFSKGNHDKISEPLYIKFPAVALMSVPVFDFVNGNILHAPLNWQVIHKGQEQSYFHIGE